MNEFDYDRGTWRRSSEGSGTMTLRVAGDWAPVRAFARLLENDPEPVYGDVLPGFRSADLSIVNLNAPLGVSGQPVVKDGYAFKGKKTHVRALQAVPVSAVTLANNHVLDYGFRAFDETLKALEKAGIQRVGAGRKREGAARPLVLKKNGLKVGIINFCEGEDMTGAGPDQAGVADWNLDRAERQIRDLKGKVNCIVVIVHCGIKYIPFPPPYVNRAFERMADAGADIVIGNHSHVPQGVRFHNQVPLFFGLGNFVFFQPTDLKFRKLGCCLDIGVDPQGLASVSVVPHAMKETGIELLKDTARQDFFHIFKEISLPLQSPATLDQAWHAFLCHYGKQGFLNELETIVIRIKTTPRKGAAMMRNRLTTRHHVHLWQDMMTGIMEDSLKDPAEWADRIIKTYMTDTDPILFE